MCQLCQVLYYYYDTKEYYIAVESRMEAEGGVVAQ